MEPPTEPLTGAEAEDDEIGRGVAGGGTAAGSGEDTVEDAENAGITWDAGAEFEADVSANARFETDAGTGVSEALLEALASAGFRHMDYLP